MLKLFKKVYSQPVADIYLAGMQRTLEEIALYVEIIKKFRQYEMGRV
ncbi:MAG: hypothetical protein GX321_07640 [Clostridiales bacterium]|nr:hypothetical protein [Clostridiales bacterium]